MKDWITKHLSDDDKRAIEAAVTAAESKTSGEIVPMIVKRSVSLRAAPYIAFMSMLSLLFAMAIFFHLDFGRTHDILFLAAGVVLSLSIAIATMFVEPLLRFFTPDGDEAEASFDRAQLEFYQTGIPSTEGRTGVLIFVSLFERRAFILGDRTISEKVDQDAWVKVAQDLVTQMKKGDVRSAFVGAIEAVGVKLAKEFPVAAGDRNELHNHLVVKD